MTESPRQRESLTSRAATALGRRVDGGSLGIFRIVLGSILALEAFDLLVPHAGGNLIYQLYTGPHVRWLVPYQGFEWLRALSGPAMNGLAILMLLAGIALAVGWSARGAAITGGLVWSYFWLLDATRYNNHYYLQSLLLLLAACMPVAARYSVGQRGDGTIPFWPLVLLRGQLFVVYFYGGVAKLNADWLLHAEPVQSLLRQPHVVEPFAWLLDPPALDQLHELLAQPAVAFGLSYLGVAYDLAVGPLLLIRRTRLVALALTAIFHAINHFVLFDDIAWFPLMALLLTTIFLEPDWPSRVHRWWTTRQWPRPDWRWLLSGAILAPGVGATLGWSIPPTQRGDAAPLSPVRRWTVMWVGLWLTIQIVLPLRHYLVPGDAAWTSEQDRFSWRMKSAAKRSGPFRVRIVDPANAARDERGNLRIGWSRLPTPHTLYQDVDARHVDWSTLPELVVLLQSLEGERVIYNPWSGQRQPRDSATARTRALALARGSFGGTIEVESTTSLTDAIRATQRLLGEIPVSRALAAQLADAERLAGELNAANVDERTFTNHLGRIKTTLFQLLQVPRLAGPLRNVLARLDPLALDGARAGGASFLAIVDDTLTQPAAQGYAEVDRARWKSPGGIAVVVADLERATPIDWKSLPEIVPIVGRDGQPQFYWNHARDLPSYKLETVQQYPAMLEPYVKFIARKWAERFGSSPQIYVTDYVGLNQHRTQLLVDPAVNLAAVRWNHWRHNAWIMPLESQEPSAHATPESTAPVVRLP